ncbi:MAG: helix-turn-helix domain-containing protein [Syntrophomonas sp.]
MAKQITKNPLTISPEKAADLLGVAPGVVRQMLYKNELPGIHLGKRWLIPVKSLENWIDAQLEHVSNS